MLDLQHQYNNCTTISHIRVSPTYWGLPLCEGLLCSCCIGVVQESNPIKDASKNIYNRSRLTITPIPQFKIGRILLRHVITCVYIRFRIMLGLFLLD
jgi:hypothetical protein